MANTVVSYSCWVKVGLVLLLCALTSTNGVYVHERRRELLLDTSIDSSDRPSIQGDTSKHHENQNPAELGMTSPKRKPFQRTLVLCNGDDDCEQKSFCHGGEGHKSCLPCRRSRRRCQRNGMCCHGNVCRQGRCVPKEMRYDSSFAKAFSTDSEEESISQHTRENMRKLREDEVCEATDQCAQGLCCAQHFWTRICKPILVEGDVCTKKRDRLTAVFQRCHCGDSLSCKRHPSPDFRYHTCQFSKTKKRLSNEDGVIVKVVNENDEPPIRIEVQVTKDELQHEWNGEADNTDGDRPDREIVEDYVSEARSMYENHWDDDDDDDVEDTNQMGESTSIVTRSPGLQASSARSVTSLMEVL
ncbi:dickkopf-related protein 2-like [Acanthaster planci]|uniref:Dickkopf-related protein 2-like n=1 Tax=Acanthaster planci TaxID=133434 RepID=A0A8B7XH65_ACAPL|nr:dickkopf-related protein 2-like [Acanthaster planci]